jgi:tetrahydromethanopterin:alpha-L-glutamate ligase
MAPPPDVLILGGRPEGWHGVRLRVALERLGLTVAWLDFAACAIVDGAVRLGQGGGLPGIVLVRSIPAGTFEQVTLRLGVLHALEDLGITVVNAPRSIERCVDKSMTSFLLARAGLPTPPTVTVQGPEAARGLAEAAARCGHRLVLKPLFGAQGRGLRLVEGGADLPPPEDVGGVYHLQRFVGAGDGDWLDFRVFTVGRRAIAAMARRGATWVTNIGRGGRAESVPARGRLAELALAAAEAVGADHAGVDLIADEDGALQILEVNSMPAWQGLQGVTAEDIAGHLALSLARRVKRQSGHPP